MPSRWLSLSIVAFWLATMGWLFWDELWPRWRPGEPPAFHVDLVEEVQKDEEEQKGDPVRPLTFWSVKRHAKDDLFAREVFSATTWVVYAKSNDTFALHARFKPSKASNGSPFLLDKFFEVKEITSDYRIDRTGRLCELHAKMNVLKKQDLDAGMNVFKKRIEEPPLPFQMEIWAEVRGEQIFTHIRGNLATLDQGLQIDLPPSPVSHNGSVVMPLHPLNRIRGLRLGQTWRQPLIDPFRDSVPGFSGGLRHVNARVLPQPKTLTLRDQFQPTCLVIEYESEGEIVGRTWVERDSERVQQQEAILNGDAWIMTRDNPNRLHPG